MREERCMVYGPKEVSKMYGDGEPNIYVVIKAMQWRCLGHVKRFPQGRPKKNVY